jgi:hypothetical protein
MVVIVCRKVEESMSAQPDKDDSLFTLFARSFRFDNCARKRVR